MRIQMEKVKQIVCCLIILSLCCALPATAVFAAAMLTEETVTLPTEQATATTAPAEEAKYDDVKQRVYDYADMLTDVEEAQLEDKFLEKSIEGSADIYYVLSNTLDGKTPKQWLEDFQDEQYFMYEIMDEDVALLFVEFEERTIVIQGYGQCEFYINNDRIEYILDDVYEFAASADYYGAGDTFATQVAYYMLQDKGVSFGYEDWQDYGESASGYSDYYGHESGYHVTDTEERSLTVSNIIWALILGLGAAWLITRKLTGSQKPKMTVTGVDYVDGDNSGITASRDVFSHTTVSKTRIQTSSGSGGGGFHGRSSGGGGRSSGGRSHSGGSRHF